MKRTFTKQNRESLWLTRSAVIAALLLINLSFVTITAQQYTLTDDDVVVTDGVIQSCSYSFEIKDIIIPGNLDGQTVTGIADMSWEKGVFDNKGIVNVQLPSTLTTIGDWAFASNQLTSVTIPNSVIEIGIGSFRNNSLSNVTIPNSVSTIGDMAFEFNSLTNITIPNSVTTIKGSAFNSNKITEINGQASNGIIYARNSDGTEDKTKIVSYGGVAKDIDFIPNTVTTIGEWAFEQDSLINIIIPNSVSYIEEGAFWNNSLTNVSISNSVTTIGKSVFKSNQLTSVTIPNSVTTIGFGAFSGNQLTSVTIPNSVTTIGKAAFWNNSLTNVTIPNSVTTISDSAFLDNQLTSVTFPTGVITIGGRAFNRNQLTSVTIPNSVTTVGHGAFASNKLTSVIIPNSVTNIGYAAFNNNSITEINGESSSGIFYVRRSDGSENKTAIVSYGGAADDIDFIPNSVTTIGYMAFENNQLTSVTIPNSVTTIGGYAFAWNQLTGVTIPNSVTTIGKSAFYDNQLTSITIPNSVTTIGDWAFSSNQLTDITIPNSVTTIGKSAFSYNQLTSITIPNSVTTIGDWSFSKNQLTGVTIPNSVTTIGKSAFSYNQLTSISLPAPVIKEGYVFTEWHDEYGMTVIEITDFYKSYEAQFDFTGVMVSGTITAGDASGVAAKGLKSVTIDDMSDVVLELSGDITGIRPVNADGTYSFALNHGRTITITPVKGGYRFEPASIELSNVQEDVEMQDFYVTVLAQQYTLTDDDVVVIDGVIQSCRYSFEIKDIIIPDTLDGQAVTGIGNSVFSNNQLTAVTIANSVTTIGDWAFLNNQLTSVTFSNSVTTIGSGAFEINQLTSVTIPNSVTTIGSGAFFNNQLKSVNFEQNSNIRLVGTYAFDYNNDLSGIILPENANEGFTGYKDTKGNSYGSGDEITDFETGYHAVLPAHTLTLGDVDFNNGVIKDYFGGYVDIIIPEMFTVDGVNISINEIGCCAFAENQLISVTIPSSVTTIGEAAFAENQLTRIVLPDPVIKEGYTFTEWLNEDSATVTEITDFKNSYEAQFYFSGVMVSGALTAGDDAGLAARGLKSVTIEDMSDVVLQLSGDITGTRPVNADGTYSFALNHGRTITITPVKEGYKFEPASIELSNVQADVEEQDFTPVEVATIVRSPGAANVKAYPNPVRAKLTIETGGAYNVLQVVNLTGAVVKTIDSENQTQLQVDMTSLSHGVYFIKLADTKQKYSPVIMKVVKK